MPENSGYEIVHARKVQTSTRNARENAKNATGTRHIAHGSLTKRPQMRTHTALDSNTEVRLINLISRREILKAVHLHLLEAKIEVSIRERRRDLGMAGTLIDQ
jgi:hypothetical protein